ncbi:helix-turn-helix domain-containing protein [Myroides sp. LJL119]
METFEDRLSFLIEYDNHSMSSFAEKIGAKRANVSHLVSGRNKPSLEFILKIKESYPDLNLNWLLNGDGSFLPNSISGESSGFTSKNVATEKTKVPDINESDLTPTLSSAIEKTHKKNQEQNKETCLTIQESSKKEKTKNNKNTQNSTSENILDSFSSSNEIDQIVVFYKDGTFKQFKSR